MTPALQHNARQFYGDIFSFGIFAGSTAAFLPVYIARLGGNSFQVALLTAAPAIMNMLLSIPAITWLEGKSLLRVTVDMMIFSRLCYVPMLLLPWLVNANVEIWILVALTALAMLPGTIINVAFNAMIADMVPPEFRAQVVGGRNALIGLSSLASSLLCGWLLGVLAFPINYQVVFAIGLVGLFGSTYFIARLRDSAGHTAHRRPALLTLPGVALRRLVAVVQITLKLLFGSTERSQPTASYLRLDLLRGPFGLFLLAYFLFYLFQNVPVPLFPLFWVNDLHLSDGVISIGNAIVNLGMLVSSALLAPVANRVGHHRLLVLSAALFGLQPLLNRLAYNVPVYIASCVVTGVGLGFVSGTLATRLMDRVPAHDRPAHMGLYNVAVYVGVMAGSLAGPVVGDLLGLRNSMLASGGLRLVAAALMWLWA